MDIIYSPDHHAHRGEFEIYRGERIPCFEKPERTDSSVTAECRNGGAVRSRAIDMEQCRS